MPSPIRTPDQRLRVFVSSTLGELAPERAAVREAIEQLHLSPVMFELGARPHPPRSLYRAYLSQSHVFVGVYWQRYGWVAPGETVSGLEDEYRLAGERPRLLYIKEPSPEREERLSALVREFQENDRASYKRFETAEELAELVRDDLALLLTERFEASAEAEEERPTGSAPPLPLTRIVGRGDELDLVVRAIRDGQRLVTLTGPGGVGKTRLALEAARALGPEYPDGAHFVPLATAADAGVAGRSIVDRLGLRTEGNWTPLEALVDYLGGRRALLVLDNLEQIDGVETWVRELLERVAGLSLLGTSRRAMRVSGEHVITVPPLPLPDSSLPLESLAEEPSVQLFSDRAREANPAFALDEETARDVAEVCRRLDGLPLAIELAAARSRLLPPAALLSRLEESFDILRSRAPDLPERQQTLRTTLEWSHQLLREAEQSLLARLSVFAGSFTLEAAEAVCDPDGSLEIMDSLTGLLDNSLILTAEDPDYVEPRFRMLETVRAFAAEQLAQRDETATVRARHLQWYRGLTRRAHPYLCGPNQRAWSARLDPERDNLRAAVATAFDSADLEGVVEFVWDLAVYYEIRDASDETRGWMSQVRERKPEFDDVMRAKLRSIDTLLRVQAGDYAGAADALTWSLEVFRANEMAFYAAVTLMVLSELQFSIDDDPSRAIATLEESIRLFESVDHAWGVARTEIMLAVILWTEGDSDGAERHLNRSLEHSRLIDNDPQIARALSLLAMIAGEREGPGERVTFLREAGEIVVRGRYQTEAIFCLDALAGALAREGETASAVEVYETSEALRERLGLPAAAAIERHLTEVSEAAASGEEGGPSRELMTFTHRESLFDYISDVLQRVPEG
jgi:predicted ATPase